MEEVISNLSILQQVLLLSVLVSLVLLLSLLAVTGGKPSRQTKDRDINEEAVLHAKKKKGPTWIRLATGILVVSFVGIILFFGVYVLKIDSNTPLEIVDETSTSDSRIKFLFHDAADWDAFQSSLEDIENVQGQDAAQRQFERSIEGKALALLQTSTQASHDHWRAMADIWSQGFLYAYEAGDITLCRRLLVDKSRSALITTRFADRYLSLLQTFQASSQAQNRDYEVPGEPNINYLYMRSRMLSQYSILQKDLILLSADFTNPELSAETLKKACYIHHALYQEVLQENPADITRYIIRELNDK